MPGSPKTSPLRLQEVEGLWRTGICTQNIQRAIAEKHHVTYRTVRRDIEKVAHAYDKLQQEEAPLRQARTFAMLEALFERAFKAGDLRVQMLAIDRMMKCCGWDAPTRVELTGIVEGPAGIDPTNPEALRVRLRELYRRHKGELEKPETPACPAPSPST